jgi:hypothetical protein
MKLGICLLLFFSAGISSARIKGCFEALAWRQERLKNGTHMLSDRLLLNVVPPERLLELGKSLNIHGELGQKVTAEEAAKWIADKYYHRQFNDSPGFAYIILSANPSEVPSLLRKWEESNPLLPRITSDNSHVAENGRLVQKPRPPKPE